MEQKPMRGLAPLDPPSADIARKYLQEADAVRARRDRRGGSRVRGWAILVTAVVIGVFLTAQLALTDSERPTGVPLFVFVIVITAQIISGAEDREGVQMRVPRNRSAFVVVMILSVIGIPVSILLQVLVPKAPLAVLAAPLWFSCLVFAGLGVAQLRVAAPAGRETSPPRPPFEKPARTSTIALGLLLATAIVTSTLADPLLNSVLLIIIVLVLVAGMIAAHTDWGLAYLGQVWRWPQYLVGAVGATILLAVTLNASADSPVDPLFGVVGGITVALATVVVALMPTASEGRDVE